MFVIKLRNSHKFYTKFISDGTLTKKAFLNSFASFLDYGARLLIGFLITPLLVSGLGEYFYGVWRILERLVGYISPVTGRSSKALKWTLANRQASSDNEEKRRFVGCAVGVWIIFFPLFIIMGGLLSWYAPVWISTPKNYFWIVRLTAWLLVSGFIIMTILEEIPRSVLEGENYGYKRMGLTTAMVFLGGGLTWLALYYDTGIVGVSIAALITIVLRSILFLSVAKSNISWFGITKPTLLQIRQFLKLSSLFLVWNLIMKAMIGSDVILLGFFNSVSSVTTYSLTKYAPEILLTLIATIVFGITPGLGGVIGNGNFKKATRIRNEIMMLTWLISTIVGTTVLLWNFAFIQLWVGEAYYAGFTPNLLIVMSSIQFVIIRNDSNIIDLTLRLSRKVLFGALSVILSIFSAVILIYYFKLGITGLCFGLISGRLVLSIFYPLIVGSFLKISFISQLRCIIRPVFINIILFYLTSKLAHATVKYTWISVNGWIQLIVLVVVTILLVTFFAFYGGLTGIQREQIILRIKQTTLRRIA